MLEADLITGSSAMPAASRRPQPDGGSDPGYKPTNTCCS